MKIYFDESGNTGCIIPNKNGALYNDEQRYFVLAGVVCRDEKDESELKERYLQFKEKYHIQGEIKGADMMKRENNAILVDFIDIYAKVLNRMSNTEIDELINAAHCIQAKIFYSSFKK